MKHKHFPECEYVSMYLYVQLNIFLWIYLSNVFTFRHQDSEDWGLGQRTIISKKILVLQKKL